MRIFEIETPIIQNTRYFAFFETEMNNIIKRLEISKNENKIIRVSFIGVPEDYLLHVNELKKCFDNSKTTSSVKEIFNYEDFEYFNQNITSNIESNVNFEFHPNIPEELTGFIKENIQELTFKIFYDVKYLTQCDFNNYINTCSQVCESQLLNHKTSDLYKNFQANKNTSYIFIRPDLKKFLQDFFVGGGGFYYMEAPKNGFFYIIKNHPQISEGIIIYKISYTAEWENDDLNFVIYLHSCFEFSPGKINKCVKIKKQTEHNILFSKFMSTQESNCFFMNKNNSLFNFIRDNEDFIKKSGYNTIVKQNIYNKGFNPFAQFIIYLMLLSEYPVIEQLAKSGHRNLLKDVIFDLSLLSNKSTINQKMDSLNNLINKKATKGSEVLRFPKYIGSYLNQFNAKIEEYFFWVDVYELTNITESEFEFLLNSVRFDILKSSAGLSDIITILKYGYPSLYELVKFINREQDKYNINISYVVIYLKDYLKMLEELKITYDLFPNNVKAAHDRILPEFNKHQISIKDKKNEEIVNILKKKNETKLKTILKESKNDKFAEDMLKKYTIVIPSTFEELAEEGAQQHNCVAGYYDDVLKEISVLFFIREKENPQKSFITAELKNKILWQITYQNNIPVGIHEDEYKFAKWISLYL